jgi:hypothetical protein
VNWTGLFKEYMICRSKAVGAIEGIVDHVFSFIDDNFARLIIAKKTKSSSRKKLRISLLFHSNLFVHYSGVLLSEAFCLRTCKVAARMGHLEGLNWARAHNCDWGVDSRILPSSSKEPISSVGCFKVAATNEVTIAVAVHSFSYGMASTSTST